MLAPVSSRTLAGRSRPAIRASRSASSAMSVPALEGCGVAVRTRPDLDRARAVGVATGQTHRGGHAVRHGDLEGEGVALERPGGLDSSVPRVEGRPGPGEPSAGARLDEDARVAGLERGDATDRAVHPVGHGT